MNCWTCRSLQRTRVNKMLLSWMFSQLLSIYPSVYFCITTFDACPYFVKSIPRDGLIFWT